jgi:hypothetical protein
VESARPLPSASEAAPAPASGAPARASNEGLPQHDGLIPFGYDAAALLGPRIVRETRIVDAGPPPPDPDDAITDAARVRAGACFHDLPPGGPPRRSATLTVYVIPTGTVSRAEVTSADTTDTRVLACLKSVGTSLKYAEKPDVAPDTSGTARRVDAGSDARGGGSAGLRTYAINVTVVAAPH